MLCALACKPGADVCVRLPLKAVLICFVGDNAPFLTTCALQRAPHFWCPHTVGLSMASGTVATVANPGWAQRALQLVVLGKRMEKVKGGKGPPASTFLHNYSPWKKERVEGPV